MKKLIVVLAFGLMIGCGGKQGDQGPAGAAAIKTLSCNKTTTLWTAGPTTLLFKYEAVTYASGDVLVICAVSGTASQSSQTSYYLTGTNGASTGSCLVTADLDANASGFWSFSGIVSPTATYMNGASAHNNYALNFAASDCQ